MQNQIIDIIQASIDTKLAVLKDANTIASIEKAVQLICSAFENDNSVWFCGNGGSAADAQHLAAEFSGRFYKDRPPLPSDALHCNTSYLTAVANDYSFDEVYARLLRGLGKKGDVLVGLSTSGNSLNIVNAFEAAQLKGIVTIGFTGDAGGKMKPLSDLMIPIPSTDTPRIQEAHMMIGHIICELVEKKLFD